MNQTVAIYVRQTGFQPERIHALQQTVEKLGAAVVGTFTDDAQLTGRGKYAGWRNLIRVLDQVDQLVVSTVGDLPGGTVAEFLKTLGILRDHGVGLYLYDEDIDTSDSNGFMLLKLIAAHRRAKLSQSIRAGQAKALAAGKRINRPKVPRRIRNGIPSALTMVTAITSNETPLLVRIKILEGRRKTYQPRFSAQPPNPTGFFVQILPRFFRPIRARSRVHGSTCFPSLPPSSSRTGSKATSADFPPLCSRYVCLCVPGGCFVRSYGQSRPSSGPAWLSPGHTDSSL